MNAIYIVYVYHIYYGILYIHIHTHKLYQSYGQLIEGHC